MSRVRIVSYANSVSLSKIAYTAKFYRQRQISTNRLRKSESVLYSPQSLDRGASSAETAAATSLVRLSEAQTDEGCIRRKPAPFKWLAPRPDRARNRIGFKSDAHAGRFCKLASFRPPKPGGEPSARPSASGLRPDGIGRERREKCWKRRNPRLESGASPLVSVQGMARNVKKGHKIVAGADFPAFYRHGAAKSRKFKSS